MKIKAKVKEAFNDSLNNYKQVAENTEIIVDKDRYDFLLSKGKVLEGEEIIEKKVKTKEDKED